MSALPPHVRLHEIRSPQDDALLEQVYNGLLKRQFPNGEELEPLEDMVKRVRAREGSIAVMMRHDPKDTEFKGEARPVGVVSSDIYQDEGHTTGLIGYITKDNLAEKEFGEKYKSHHLRDFTVERMHEMVKEDGGKGLDLVLWEADRIDNHTGSMDPQMRQDIISGKRAQNQGEGWNFERVGHNNGEFEYVGPPLEEGNGVDKGMDLFAAGVRGGPDGKAMLKAGGISNAHEAQAAKSFLSNYWEACEMEADHPELQKMQGSMDRMVAREEVKALMYGGKKEAAVRPASDIPAEELQAQRDEARGFTVKDNRREGAQPFQQPAAAQQPITEQQQAQRGYTVTDNRSAAVLERREMAEEAKAAAAQLKGYTVTDNRKVGRPPEIAGDVNGGKPGHLR